MILRRRSNPARVLALLVASVMLTSSLAAARQMARIEGRVYAPGGHAVQNVRVTILNDGYSPLRSVYSDSAGRFQFRVPEGAYYIEVDPLDKPFVRQQQRVDLNPTPFSKLGELFMVDILLSPSKNAANAPQPKGGELVYYQAIPDTAKVEYERGLKLLGKNPSDAFAAMRKALQIFPDYYAAMETLGSEYVKAGHLNHALPILLRAVEINPQGNRAYYALGVLFYQMRHYPNAVKAFNRVLAHDQNDVNAVVYRGLSLMRDGQVTDAETALKKAYDLGARNVPEIQLALSQIYIKQERFAEAATELERLLVEDGSRKDRKKIEKLIQSLKSKASKESARR